MRDICCKCNLPKEVPKSQSGSASFRYICRLCLMRAEDTEPIFIHPGDNTLANKIFACTGVQIDENAAIGPTSICMSCKTSIYKGFQFLELCQRNNKIIENLLATHEKSVNNNGSNGTELRLVIRTNSASTTQKDHIKRKRTNSRRNSTLSILEMSTSASDVSWSDCDDDKEEIGDDDATDEIIPFRQVAYETDTQEESPKRQRLSTGENKVPSLVIPRARLNGGFLRSPSQEHMPGRISRASTIEPLGEDDLFSCEFCDGSFPYRIQIKQHIDLYHTDRKHELECKFCSKTYLSTETLRKHYEQKHASASSIECKLCQRFFSSQSSLQKHYSTIMHRAACGEAVFPSRRYSGPSPARRMSMNSDYGSDYPSSGSRPRRRSTHTRVIIDDDDDDFNPYDNVCYDEIDTYKCDYCDARFDDRQTLAKHTDVRPCRVELEPLDLDLLLEKMDLDELLMPLHTLADVAIIEPAIEIVDLT